MFGQREITLTPELPTSFATLAEAKAFIGVTDALSDALLQGFLDATPFIIEQYCNNLITPRAVVEIVNLEEPCTQLVLSYANMTALTSITVDSQVIPPANLRATMRTGIMSQIDGTQFSGKTLTATYAVGYASVPAAIKQATLVVVQEMYFANKVPGNVASESLEGVGSVTYESSESDMIKGPTGGAMYASAIAHLSPFVRRFHL